MEKKGPLNPRPDPHWNKCAFDSGVAVLWIAANGGGEGID